MDQRDEQHTAFDKDADLTKFYENFRNAIREVKLSLEGQIVLNEANDWLREIQ